MVTVYAYSSLVVKRLYGLNRLALVSKISVLKLLVHGFRMLGDKNMNLKCASTCGDLTLFWLIHSLANVKY